MVARCFPVSFEWRLAQGGVSADPAVYWDVWCWGPRAQLAIIAA